MNAKSDDETKVKCENAFMLSALPGSDVNNFYEALWQFFSIDALEHMTIICDDSGKNKKLTLRAVVTERIKFHLETLFEGYFSFTTINRMLRNRVKDYVHLVLLKIISARTTY